MTWLNALLGKLRALFSTAPPSAVGAGVDDELREVFLAELSEMINTASNRLAAWRADPADLESARALGRVFHTLKGSAPIIEADALAEVGRAGEEAMRRAIEQRGMSATQLAAIESALELLPRWKDAIRNRGPAPTDTRAVTAGLMRSAGR